MSNELSEGRKVKAFTYARTNQEIRPFPEATIREQAGQEAMVPWIHWTDSEGKEHLANCAYIDWIELGEADDDIAF